MTILWPPFVGWMFFCSLLFRILSRTRVIGYLTKDFDPATGEWSLDWIRTGFFGFDDEEKTGIIINTVQLEPSILKGVDGKKISYMAYEFVTGPSTTPGSPYMLHTWTYTINPPDIESILATKSSFYKLEKDNYATPFLMVVDRLYMVQQQ